MVGSCHVGRALLHVAEAPLRRVGRGRAEVVLSEPEVGVARALDCGAPPDRASGRCEAQDPGSGRRRRVGYGRSLDDAPGEGLLGAGTF